MSPAPTPDPADATMNAAPLAPRAFASGRYVVKRILPEGGQKTVYLVHDTALDRDCALALIKADRTDADDLERLRREAQAMARLGAQPNIVAVYDIGDENGNPYLISEYIAGGDLRRQLVQANGPLPVARAIAIAADVALGLAAAHGRGVIHRDIKPGNILLTEDGTAKLGDFGLALAIDRSQLTSAGTVLGTAAYMPPEQSMGQSADARSDLYALGCVLYEMVTGRPPFLGADVLAVISQHVNTSPVAPSWHNPEAPRALESLIMKLLAKSPDERPASADEVAQELRRILDRPTADVALEPPRDASGDLRGIAWGRFVGRREEMDQLKVALEDMLSGRGSLAMVAGEPGIGKTRLTEEFGVYAGLRGAQVLTGHCYEGEASIPYRPFVEGFRRYARSRPDQEVRSQMSAGAPEIATLISDIRQRFPDIEEAPKLDPEAERLRLFESVAEFLHNASLASPIVLQLDDLHWADKPSLLLLQYLTRSMGGDRVLIVGAYRDIELGRTHALAEAMATLRRAPNYRRVLLRGLPEEDVMAMLSIVEDSDRTSAARRGLAEALFRETEGNPLFVREVMNSLIEDGKIFHRDGVWTSNVRNVSDLGIPEGIREVIGRRLSRLSDGCNRMLTLASTMPGGFTWEALTAVSDVPERELLDFLDEALAAQLLHERKRELAGSYEFTHALIRQTLYEELSTPRRVLLHRQIGEALEALYAANVEPHLAELAHHFFQSAPGGDVEKAIDYARRAGDRSLSLVAWEEAAGHYDRALQALELLPVRDERRQAKLLLALGEALERAGDRERYKEVFTRAADVARRIGDTNLFASAALQSAPAPTLFEVDPQAVALLEEALGLLAPGDGALRAEVTAKLAAALYFSDQRERRTALELEALAMARRVGDKRTLAHTLGLITMFAPVWVSPPYGSVSGLIDEVIHLAEETGDKGAASAGYNFMAKVSLARGDRDAADAAIEAHERLSGELRVSGSLVFQMRAMQAGLDGRFDAAAALAHQGLVDGQRAHPQNAPMIFGAQMFDLRRAQGRLVELEAGAKEMVERFPLIPGYRAVLALVYQEQDRREEARALFDELARDDFAVFVDREDLSMAPEAIMAELCCYLDDRPRAAVLYEMLLPMAEYCVVTAAVSCHGSASARLGALAATLGRFDKAEQHFDQAIAMNLRLRAPTWVAQTQLDYARMLLMRDQSGDRARALGLLSAALDVGERVGMRKLVEDARRLTLKAQEVSSSDL